VWRPAPGTSWQWQIVGRVDAPYRAVHMYDIDLTDAVPRAMTLTPAGFPAVRWPAGTNAGVIDRLHAAGKTVICYLDTGAWERYEPDAALFPGTPGWRGEDAGDVIGNSTGWDDEYWLDIRPGRRAAFAPIIWSRLELAKRIGCDGVEPDQNNPWGNDPGPSISLSDEKSWYLEVAGQAHARGLSVGMKNGVEIIDAELVAAFDWSLNEECFFYDECDRLRPFVAAGKAVFQVEYTDDWGDRGYAKPLVLAGSAEVCAESRRRSFATLIKPEVPDGSFVAC
ncbi:MAG: endo alpha-1,4 polygalactosaminidase, partial [Dactylosporangium sp.]|nr:endo alpha-1,4 polygalactosaminidase [Dactylosporangium sp.]